MTWKQKPQSNGAVAEERRAAERYDADGEILLFVEGLSRPVVASLLDVSASGFRARHTYSSLESGQKVVFQHSSGSGEAVAVWKRLMGKDVEGGFVIKTAPYVW